MRFLRFLPRLLIVVILVLASRLTAATTAALPDIVFILADDLGWGDVGFHGGEVPTPHLDRLARESLELTQHYVHPMCTPTRAAFLSGRYASRFGVTGAQNEPVFPAGTTTLAQALKSRGYDTALVGKWHLGSDPTEGPQQFGFDHSYGSLAGGVGPWDHRYKQGPHTRTWHRNGELLEEEGHVTDLLTREAVNWLERPRNRPAFLYLAYTAVHIPIREPAAYLERVPAGIEAPSRREFAACLIHLDDAVGEILAAIERTGRAGRTLVVFTSDNGATPLVRNDDPKYPADGYVPGPAGGSNRPLRGQKTQLYEGGIRVPTLLRWPGQVTPGRSETLAHIVDWMPTFCAFAGYQPAGDLRWDGHDLRPRLTSATPAKPRAVYGAGVQFRSRYVREGDWKLIVASSGDGAEQLELFNLRADPAEEKNRAAAEPDRVRELRARLEALAVADRDALRR